MGLHKSEVKVGVGATLCIGSDRYAYTVVKVSKTGHKIEIQRDNARATKDSNYYGSQKYTFTPNLEANIYSAYWSEKRGCYRCGHANVHVGHRDEYMDPHF